MRIISLLILLVFHLPEVKAWQTDSVNGNLVLRQHFAVKAGLLMRVGPGVQGAFLIAPKSWLHIQTGVGVSSTWFATKAHPRRSYLSFNGEIRLHNPNSYSFKGKFIGVYYSLNGGQWKYKEPDGDPNIGSKHKATYQSISNIIGLVLGASTVGRKHDYLYYEGFISTGWSVKTIVTGSDSRYFTGQETPIARNERFELKVGVLLGVVAY